MQAGKEIDKEVGRGVGTQVGMAEEGSHIP